MAYISENIAVKERKAGLPVIQENRLPEKGGQPRKWASVEVLQKLIDDYFESTAKEDWTVSELCLALDADRETLMRYQGAKEFSYAIKKAKLKIAGAYETDLRHKNNPSGSIFALKNFGWTDQQQVDLTSGGQAFAVNVMTFGQETEPVDAEYEEIDENK